MSGVRLRTDAVGADRLLATAVGADRRGRSHGLDELLATIRDLHCDLLQLWTRAVWALLVCLWALLDTRDLWSTDSLQRMVAAPIPVRSVRVGLALADLCAAPTDAKTAACRGLKDDEGTSFLAA